MRENVVITCPAKINLFLNIICKRSDGYHNIETIFQSISLSDLLEIELASSEMVVSSNDPNVPSGESNLACSAFRKMAGVIGYEGGIRIHIEKNIPPKTGLGGGSSNAAATLVAMNHLLQIGMTEEELCKVGGELGADVPFFILGGLAAAWQVGDKMLRLPSLPESHLIVAFPHNISVSTKEAYGLISVENCGDAMPEDLSNCSDRLQANVSALRSSAPLSGIKDIGSVLFNAFEKPVFSRYPAIAKVKNALLTAGARGALMSGSGSAVFALAESIEHAREIKRFAEGSSGCECRIVCTTDCGCESKA